MIPATRPTSRAAIAPTYAAVEITLFVTVVVAVVVLSAVDVAVLTEVVVAVLVTVDVAVLTDVAVVVAVVVDVAVLVTVDVDVTVVGGDVLEVVDAPGALGDSCRVTQVEMLLVMSWSCISVQPVGAGTPAGMGCAPPSNAATAK